MNAATLFKVTKDEFFEFVQSQAEGKFEYEDGFIVQQMTGGTNAHARLITRISFLCMRDLDQQTYAVTSQSRGIDTPRTVRYPDVVVERVGATRESLYTQEPLVIVEVLSPKTEKLDLNVKSKEFIGLPSLLTYLAVSQYGPEVHVWRRQSDGTIDRAARKVAGLEATVPITALGIELRLADIYRGIL